MKLSRFDAVILDVALRRLRSVREALLGAGIPDSHPRLSVAGTITALENISGNRSLERQYKQMYNQCAVLLVSYFESAMREFFRERLAERLRGTAVQDLLEREMKLRISDLLELGVQPEARVAELIARDEHLSFQDTRSIGRALGTYLGYSPPFDEITRTVAYGQACRHVIVHSGGETTERFLRQVRELTPRRFGSELSTGRAVQFTPEDIGMLGSTMDEYLTRAEVGTSARAAP